MHQPNESRQKAAERAHQSRGTELGLGPSTSETSSDRIALGNTGTGKNETVRSHPLEKFIFHSSTPDFLKWFLARMTVHLVCKSQKDLFLRPAKKDLTQPVASTLASQGAVSEVQEQEGRSAGQAARVAFGPRHQTRQRACGMRQEGRERGRVSTDSCKGGVPRDQFGNEDPRVVMTKVGLLSGLSLTLGPEGGGGGAVDPGGGEEGKGRWNPGAGRGGGALPSTSVEQGSF